MGEPESTDAFFQSAGGLKMLQTHNHDVLPLLYCNLVINVVLVSLKFGFLNLAGTLACVTWFQRSREEDAL